MNGKKFRNPIDKVMVYLLAMFWVVPPSHDASHHQDTCLGGRGSLPRPSFATITGDAGPPNIYRCTNYLYTSFVFC